MAHAIAQDSLQGIAMLSESLGEHPLTLRHQEAVSQAGANHRDHDHALLMATGFMREENTRLRIPR
jgi:hypothetical protein